MVKTKGSNKKSVDKDSQDLQIIEQDSLKEVFKDPGVGIILPSGLEGADEVSKSRLDLIQESHALLRSFDPKELKILINLKRNTSPKAWSLREDLIVLTLPMSNREIAEVLKGRNKEAVKKRLQLLKSKGLTKRNQVKEIETTE